MKWLELSVETPPEFVEPLTNIFYRYGHGGVATEEPGGHNPDEGEVPAPPETVIVKTYLPLDSTADERRSRIDLAVRLVAHLSPLSELRQRVLEEEDWERSWKEHFHVLRAGKRIVIVPTWRRHRPADSDVVVHLDPGMAFGTGHHPTTRMCLEILEETVRPGADVLDLGCGSGILAIAAAKLGARSVRGLEIDAVAATVAESNVRQNDVAATVSIAHGTLPHPDVHRCGFDVALANISATVVVDLAEELAAALRPRGTLVVSGVLLENESRVSRRLSEVGFVPAGRRVDSDWVAMVVLAP